MSTVLITGGFAGVCTQRVDAFCRLNNARNVALPFFAEMYNAFAACCIFCCC